MKRLSIVFMTLLYLGLFSCDNESVEAELSTKKEGKLNF
jgi:hypothetical protein